MSKTRERYDYVPNPLVAQCGVLLCMDIRKMVKVYEYVVLTLPSSVDDFDEAHLVIHN
jgi:hypothetical protein